MKRKITGAIAVLCLMGLIAGCQTKPSEQSSEQTGMSSLSPTTSAQSEVLVSESSVPESSVRESSVPESSVPESSVIESSVAESSIAESSVPESSMAESSIAESSVPESSVAEPSVAESSVAESSVPESTVVESSVAESSVVESSVLESSVAKSSVSEPSHTAVVSQVEPPPAVKQPIVDAYTPYTFARLQRDIDALCRRYPDLVTQYAIGVSAQGRKISCVTLGFGDKKGCIVSGIHAREHITVSFTMRCLEEFAQAYQNNEPYGAYDLRQLLNEYTLYFVPMCNPDGTEIATNGAQPLVYVNDFSPDEYKLNANGVNLNRNFPYNWENQYTHQTTVAGEEKYAGHYAASEKETQAIMSLCADEGFAWLLDMHVVGNGIYWRDEMNGAIEGDSRMRDAITERCGYRYFGMSDDVTIYSGGLENWFRYAYGRPAFCIEMVPYEQSGRVSTYIGLNSFFEEAVNWHQTKYTYLEAMVSG